MNKDIFSFYFDLLYNLLVFLTYSKYCNYYLNRKGTKFRYLRNFSFTIITQVIVSYIRLSHLGIVINILYFIFNIFTYNVTMKANLYHVIRFNIFFYIPFIINLIVLTIFFDSKTLLKDKFYQSLKMTIICAIIYIIFALVFNNKKMYHNRIYNPYKKFVYLLLISIILILFSLIIYSIQYDSNKETLESIVLITFLINIVMIILIITIYEKIVAFLQESALEQLKLQKYELNQNYFDELSVKSKQLSSLRHDFKNHLGVLRGRLEQKDYEAAILYLNSIIERSQAASEIIITNNPTISSILQAKKSECERKEISFEFTVGFEKIYKVSDMDLIIILGNILDNAISAADNDKLENKKIHLSIYQADTFLVIICVNNFVEKPVEINGQLITTKNDKNIHGIGLMNVSEVCDKYDGESNYTYDEQTFTIKILLPNY